MLKKSNISKVRKNNKLELSVLILSVFQLAMYCWAVYLSISANHNETLSVEEALAPMFPAILFLAFGLVNLIVFIVYLVNTRKNNIYPSKLILILIGLLIILTVFSPQISKFLNTI